MTHPTGELREARTPHRRRTPCCEIEAHRYLETHGAAQPASPCREKEAYDAGRLAGFEEGLAQSAPTVERLATAMWDSSDEADERPWVDVSENHPAHGVMLDWATQVLARLADTEAGQ